MRAYTLTILTKLAGEEGHPIVEKEIVAWANNKVGIGWDRYGIQIVIPWSLYIQTYYRTLKNVVLYCR